MGEEEKGNSQDNHHDTANYEAAADYLSDNQASDWKKALSGALDEERLLCALVVLCIFYIGLTLGNAYHDNNEKDEDEITESCDCKHEHMAFYRGWSIICYALWLGCHCVVHLNNNPTHFEKLKVLVKKLLLIRENKRDSVQWKWQTKCCYCITCITGGKVEINKTDIAFEDKINNSKYHLWTQYYELYVIGITKNSEKSELNHMLDKYIIAKEAEKRKHHKASKQKKSTVVRKRKESEGNEPTTEDTAHLVEHMEGHSNIQAITPTAQAETTTALPRYQIDQSCTSRVQTVFHHILSLIRFIAQLAVVPLLMIQILDTYAYLCFTANSYCNMRSQYKLHLDQTAMTFAFYCSLMISLLSTTMVRWFPLPEKREVKPLECENDTMIPHSVQQHQSAA